MLLVLDPAVGLHLWVNQERIGYTVADQDGIVNRDGVTRETLGIPLTGLDRIAQNALQRVGVCERDLQRLGTFHPIFHDHIAESASEGSIVGHTGG